MANGPNLFARLRRWAARQDENFLTESLALLLEHLLILAPEAAVRLVGRFTGGFIDLAPENAAAIDIRTQVETGKGRPDLEISTLHRLAWVEVKAEADLRIGQLEGYRVLLQESGAEQTRLILLTQIPAEFQSEEAHPDLEIRWFEFADWLESELPAIEAAGEVAGFLARQFLDFLRVRHMTLTQVGKHIPEGVRDLSSLLNMLYEAARACKVPIDKKSASWDYMGLNLDGMKYWIGIDFADPEKLWFGTRCRIDPEAAAKLGVGNLTEESGVPGRYRWWRTAELNSESIHFSARSKISQMEWLEGFLHECLTMARSITTPDQPPISEEPEGS